MAFTIVADIDEKKLEKSVLKLADKFFQNYTNSCTSAAECHAGIAPCGNYRTPEAITFDKTLNKRNYQANCIIGGLAPSLYQERERLATVLLCNILGGPANNSILNATLREKHGWVYSVECGYTQFADTGMVTISLGCDKSNIDKCIDAVYKELAKLQNELLSDRKLKAAKKQLLGQLAISSDNNENQCLSMGKALLAFGKIDSGKDNRTKVEGITAEDLQEVARSVFDISKLSKLIYI